MKDSRGLQRLQDSNHVSNALREGARLASFETSYGLVLSVPFTHLVASDGERPSPIARN